MKVSPASPSVTIAMTAYNVAPYIGAAIESLLAQTYGDFELLIVDDQSNDASRAVAERFAAADGRVQLVASGEKGRVPALNRILGEARGAWFAVFDADDVARPDKFERQMAFLKANPDHGVVGSGNRTINADGRLLVSPPFDRPLRHEDLIADMESGIKLLHSTMIARTELVRQVGGYRAPFRYSQDYDLYLRLAGVTRMANLEEKLVDYRVYSDQVSTRHLVAQTLSATVAWYSHRARAQGQADPLSGMSALPALGTLDHLFGVTGADAHARARIIERIVYSPETLAGDGYSPLLDHIREAGASATLWRAAARMLKAGFPGKAARVGLALATA